MSFKWTLFLFKERIIFFLSIAILLSTVSTSFSQAPNWFAEQVKKRRSGFKEPTTEQFIEDLWNTIYTISQKYKIDPVFITAVIAVESNFRNVQGPGGVLGMMQILPSTARGIAKLLNLEVPKDWNALLTDYKLNITYGTAYLSYLYKKTGSLSKALEEYNNGKNKVTYAQTIMKQYEYYKGLHDKELAQKNNSQTSVKSIVPPSTTTASTSTSSSTEQIPSATSTNVDTSTDIPADVPTTGATETNIGNSTAK